MTPPLVSTPDLSASTWTRRLVAFLALGLLICIQSCKNGGGPPAQVSNDPPRRQPKDPGERSLLMGRVTDVSGNPVADAKVVIQGRPDLTVSGKDGGFRFLLPHKTLVPLVLAASKPGYYTGGTRISSLVVFGLIQLEPLPPADPSRNDFLTSKDCSACHIEEVKEWKQSRMGWTGMNAWVHDLLDGTGTSGGAGGFVYMRDGFHSGKLPFSDCSSCHTPLLAKGRHGASMGNLKNPSPLKIESVTCDLCHKIKRVDLNFENFPGVHPKVSQFHLPKDEPSNPLVFGSLLDSTYSNGVMKPSYSPLLADGHSLCATCHEDNVDVDGDGDYQDEGSLSHMSTYSEWRSSRYAVQGEGRLTCVDCHMPLTTRTTIANLNGVEGRRVFGHNFPSLRSLGQSVDLRIRAEKLPDRKTLVTIEVENTGAGHSIPTGVMLRNVLLIVEAETLQNPIPLVVGSRLDKIAGEGGLASNGYYSGVAGKVYARVFRDRKNNWPAFSTEAISLVYDTRLAAGAIDKQVFVFGATTETVFVKARLIYRRAYRSVVDQKGWKTDGFGLPLEDLKPPWFGVLLKRVQTVSK